MDDKLYLSGMDSNACRLARKWRLGYEVVDYCYAPMLDNPATAPRVRSKVQGIDHLWFHAPFAELSPCAIDPLVRDIVKRRILQSSRTALELGIHNMVCHGGFIPNVYFPKWYVEHSISFWKELLGELPSQMTIAVENVLEPSPKMLVEIASGVGDPRLGLCLDVGHANVCAGEVPPLRWIAPMQKWLRHVHIHNNDGCTDLHNCLGDGCIDMEEVLETVLELVPNATITIENQNCMPSLNWLADRDYIEAV